MRRLFQRKDAKHAENRKEIQTSPDRPGMDRIVAPSALEVSSLCASWPTLPLCVEKNRSGDVISFPDRIARIQFTNPDAHPLLLTALLV